MPLLPRLCMATATSTGTGDGDGDGEGNSNSSSSSKLATAVSSSSSSSSTVSSSSAAAAAVSSEASSSSSPSLPSLPSLSSSAPTTTSLAASLVHVTTLLPPSAPSPSSSAAVVAASADSLIVVVARPASVALHDLSTLEPTSSTSTSTSTSAAAATAAAGSVKCVAYLPGTATTAATAVTGHQDGRLRLWLVSTRSPTKLRLAASLPTVADRLRRFPVPSNHVPVRRHHRRLWIEHADAVFGVASSPDGRLLFSVSWDKTLKVWSLPSLRCLQSLPAHDDAVNAVAVATHPDGGSTVYTASADKRVRVWAPCRDAGGEKKKKKKKKPVSYQLVATLCGHTAAVNAVAVGCGGKVVYSGGSDRCVVVWERREENHMVAVGALRGHRRAVLSVACAPGPGGMVVVSGAADRTVRAWRRADEDGGGGGRGGYACVAVIEGHGAAVRSVAVARVPAPASAVQKRDRGGGEEEEWKVCSASFDGEVRVWSLRVSSAAAGL